MCSMAGACRGFARSNRGLDLLLEPAAHVHPGNELLQSVFVGNDRAAYERDLGLMMQMNII